MAYWNGQRSPNGFQTTTNIDIPLFHSHTINNAGPTFYCTFWDTTDYGKCIVNVRDNGYIEVYKLRDFYLLFNFINPNIGYVQQVRTQQDYLYIVGENEYVVKVDTSGNIVWAQDLNNIFVGARGFNLYPNITIDDTNIYLSLIADGTISDKKLLVLSLSQADGSINWFKILRDNHPGYIHPFHPPGILLKNGYLYLQYTTSDFHERYAKIDASNGETAWDIESKYVGFVLMPINNLRGTPTYLGNNIIFYSYNWGFYTYNNNSYYFHIITEDGVKIKLGGYGNYLYAQDNNYIYGYDGSVIKQYDSNGEFIKEKNVGDVIDMITDNNKIITSCDGVINVYNQEFELLEHREKSSDRIRRRTRNAVNPGIKLYGRTGAAADEGTYIVYWDDGLSKTTGISVYNNFLRKKSLDIKYDT